MTCIYFKPQSYIWAFTKKGLVTIVAHHENKTCRKKLCIFDRFCLISLLYYVADVCNIQIIKMVILQS